MKAKQLGCIIPEPIAVCDLVGDGSRGRRKPEYVLVDEVGYMLKDALKAYLGTDVECATLTDVIKEMEQMKSR